MIREVRQEDREEYLKMAHDFYHSPAVLHPIPDSYIEKTFEECISSGTYGKIYMLEYEGSMMYDERPDYETVLRIRDKVLEKAKDELEPMEPPERDEMLTMQYRPGPPRRRRGNWPGDFAQMMLLEEMHRRRCRSCRRW